MNLYPKNFSVTGNFALKFDLWINYPVGKVPRFVAHKRQAYGWRKTSWRWDKN